MMMVFLFLLMMMLFLLLLMMMLFSNNVDFSMKYSGVGNGLLASNADHKGPHSGHTDRLLRYRKCSDLNRNYYMFVLECNVLSNCPTQQRVRLNEKKAQKVDPFQSFFCHQ